MGDANQRLATLQRGLRDLRAALTAIEPDDERAVFELRVARLEARAALWDSLPRMHRAALLNGVLEATLEVSEVRRRSGQWRAG